MAALTADRNTTFKAMGRSASKRVAASTQIFKGSIVRENATGFLIPGDDAAAGLNFAAWIAEENVDNTGGADGDLRCRCRKGTVLLENDGNVVQATVGDRVFAADDQTVALAGAGTADNLVGTVDDFDDGGQVVVSLSDES